jgi:hypothetical protein
MDHGETERAQQKDSVQQKIKQNKLLKGIASMKNTYINYNLN